MPNMRHWQSAPRSVRPSDLEVDEPARVREFYEVKVRASGAGRVGLLCGRRRTDGADSIRKSPAHLEWIGFVRPTGSGSFGARR